MLAAGNSLLPLSFISFFRRLISEVALPIVTKLCHMFDGDTDKILSEIWVAQNLAAQKNIKIS